MEQNRATIASFSRGITTTSDQPGLSFAVLLTWIRCPGVCSQAARRRIAFQFARANAQALPPGKSPDAPPAQHTEARRRPPGRSCPAAACAPLSGMPGVQLGREQEQV